MDESASAEYAKLVAAAREARQHAYCPYSGVAVGAAVLTRSGEVFTGCNVENTTLGLTVCAERNAISAAVRAGMRPGELAALVVVGGDDEPLTPCGACRQVLAEFAANECPAICATPTGRIRAFTLGELLPHQFKR